MLNFLPLGTFSGYSVHTCSKPEDLGNWHSKQPQPMILRSPLTIPVQTFWDVNFTRFSEFHTGLISVQLLWYLAYHYILPYLSSLLCIHCPAGISCTSQINYIHSDSCFRCAQTEVLLITHILLSPCSFELAWIKSAVYMHIYSLYEHCLLFPISLFSLLSTNNHFCIMVTLLKCNW